MAKSESYKESQRQSAAVRREKYLLIGSTQVSNWILNNDREKFDLVVEEFVNRARVAGWLAGAERRRNILEIHELSKSCGMEISQEEAVNFMIFHEFPSDDIREKCKDVLKRLDLPEDILGFPDLECENDLSPS